MGAYDNPKIIQPPDYAEIFMKSFAGGQALVEKAFAGKKQKAKEKEAKLDRAYQDTSKVRQLGGAIKAGDLTANVRRQANQIADDFNINELAYIDGKIDRNTYQTTKDKYMGKLQSMVDIGAELNKIDIDKIDVSRYQPDGGKTLGLVEAWKSRAIDVDFNGDVPALFYSDPNNNRVDVTLGALNNIQPDDLSINTIFKIGKDDRENFVDAKGHEGTNGVFRGSDNTIPDGTGRTVQIKTYESGDYKSIDEALLANKAYEENALNGIRINVSQFYEGLENDQKGSLFSDGAWASFTEGKAKGNKFRPGMKERFDELLNNPDLGLSDEDKKYIEKQILEGTYSGSDEQIAGMDALSQDVLVKQTFDNNFEKAPEFNSKRVDETTVKAKATTDRLNELRLEKAEQEAAGGDEDEITDLLDYFSQDTGPLGFGGNVTKAKSANKFIQNMKSNGFFDANNNFKTTAEIIKAIRDTKNQGVYGYDVTEGRQFKNFKTADEVNDIIPIMKKAAEVKGGGEPLTEQDMLALQNFGFSQTNFKNTNSRNNMNKFVRYFEELGINGTDDIFSSDNVNSYFEFKEANRGGFTTTDTPGTKGMYKDSGAAGTQKFLADLPLSNDLEGGTKVSAIDIGNIVNELYDKKGLYQYLKFN